MRNSAKRILDFVDLRDGELSFFTPVGLRLERANSVILSCHIVVRRSLDDVFRTALDVGQDRSVWANEKCRLKSGQDAHGTPCARLTSVEAPGL